MSAPMNRRKLVLWSLGSLLLVVGRIPSVRAEEALDLDAVTAPPVTSAPPVPSAHSGSAESSPPHLLGRVDLTYDMQEGSSSSQFRNFHYLVFLKAQASRRTKFFGQLLGSGDVQFFDVSYQATDWLTAHVGRVLVPFGDTSRFHHFYGGEQGNGVGGILFPNLWSKPGLNFEWMLGRWTLDTYLVNGMPTDSTGTEPDFASSSGGTSLASGLRLSRAFGKVRGVASVYYQEWVPGRPLLIVGGDIVTDYRLIDAPVARSLRLNAGRAIGYILEGSTGDFRRSGDFIELSTNALGFGEPRLRYGTYVKDSRAVSADDVHNWCIAYAFHLDALRILIEHQWNMESVNERANDLNRLMVSMDF